MNIVLGLDIGTQSVKALLYDSENHKTLGITGASLELIARNDGTREQEARWWIEGIKTCIQKLDPQLVAQIRGVGVSGQQHGFVPLDKDGNVLVPVKLWCDTATVAQCTDITKAYGGVEPMIENVGNPILPGYTASKILWLKQTHPELFKKLATVLLPHDYINFKLTGNRVMEAGDASGTGLLNIRTRTWDEALAKTIDPSLPQCLPRLIEAWEPAGRISPLAAEEFGLPEGVFVSAGGGDNMMGAIGTGAVKPGVVTVSLGTSGTMYTASTKPVIDPRGEIAAFCSSTDTWLPLLCTMNCTIATEKTREQYNLSVEELNSLASAAVPGSDGVITLPFYNGERTPNMPDARACVVGMTYENGKRENIIRSSMESAVFGLKQGLDRFMELGLPVENITLVGGGAKSVLWAQICSDIFQLPLRIPQMNEAAAFGAAIQALWCLDSINQGGVQDIQNLADEHVWSMEFESYAPNSKTSSAYEKSYNLYKQYLQVLKPLWAAMEE